METKNATVKHNNALLDIIYDVYLEEREFIILRIEYYGIDVTDLLSEIDIEEITEQIRKDNE